MPAYQPILTELLTTKEDIAKDPVQVLPIVAAYANRDKNMLKSHLECGHIQQQSTQ
jgi:hypothetical protein